jgi:hypothetical protein
MPVPRVGSAGGGKTEGDDENSKKASQHESARS